MPSDSYLFPRLPAVAARMRMAEVSGRSPAQLGALASAQCAEAIYPATGGARIAVEYLDGIRQVLLEQARALGFPSPEGADAVRFDWMAAPLLVERLPMSPGEACRNEVWSFLTLQLLPDIATWRFPNQNERRFLGGARNAFQRLWWRAHLLRDSDARDPWHLLRLPEDALVGLFERPGISSNPHVTRCIGNAISTIVLALPRARREDGWRLSYKYIRQRIPIVNLDALDQAELIRQLHDICTRAVAEPARGTSVAAPEANA